MKIDLLYAFRAVIEYGTISRAAEALFMSQSTVSRQIQELEKLLGCSLFIREKRRLSLSQAGEMLKGRVTRILREWEGMLHDAETYSKFEGNTLRIGYTYAQQLPLISRALERGDYPNKNLDLTLHRAEGPVITSMLRNGELHCAVMHRPSLAGVEDMRSTVIMPVTMEIMVPLKNPLSAQQSVTLQQLSQQTEVRTSQEKAFYDAADKVFFDVGLKPMRTLVTDDPNECEALARYHGYVCYVPSMYPAWKDCKKLPINGWTSDYDLLFVEHCAVHRTVLSDLFYNALCASVK